MNGRCPEENRHGSFLLLLLEWCNLGDKDDSELSLHHEFNPSSTKIGHVRAKTLLDYIKSINNPFDAGIRLQNISTGADIPQEVVDGLFECLEIGEKSYEEFVKTRFQNKEKHLHDTIPTNRKTVFVKRISTPSTAKISMAKKDAAETIRYINYARERGYSMLELLKYELTSTSQFLTTECKDGIKLKKPDKASLARELVSHLPQETRNVKSDAQMTIVDFMALVRKLPMKKMGLHTFEELAKTINFAVKELSPQITSNAEKLLVSGLKKTDCSTFDEYRWEQYHNSKKELDFNQLVCCSSTIREHIKRAYLQCKMWLQAPTPVVTKPDPLQYGYEATDVGTTSVILPVSCRPDDLPPACKCPRACMSTKTCTCRDRAIKCVTFCGCSKGEKCRNPNN
ncbi:hypothetical protein GQR58_029262 [Nymphon striatum]|nr:hypothetical protein GQR58_029262 [Nymphon striatum]